MPKMPKLTPGDLKNDITRNYTAILSRGIHPSANYINSTVIAAMAQTPNYCAIYKGSSPAVKNGGSKGLTGSRRKLVIKRI